MKSMRFIYITISEIAVMEINQLIRKKQCNINVDNMEEKRYNATL